MSTYYPSVYIVGNSGRLYLVSGTGQYGTVNETVNVFAGQNQVLGAFAADQVGNSETPVGLPLYVGEVLEDIHTQDTRGAIWAGVYERVKTPSVLGQFAKFSGLVQEFSDYAVGHPGLASATAIPANSDALTVTGAWMLGFLEYLSDTTGVILDQTVVQRASCVVSNIFRLLGPNLAVAHAALIVAEVVGALEKVAGALQASAENNETIGLNMAVLGAILLQYTVSEHVSLLDSIPASAKAYPALAELLGLQDAQSSGFGKEINETAGLTALIADLLSARPQIIDILNSLDTTAPTFVVQITCSDTAEIIDPPTGGVAQAVMQALASENFSIFIGYTANDGVYDGWVINTNSSAVSQYAGWSFNSFAEFYGQYLGASASGLSVLNGTTDAGTLISATIQTAVTDLGSSHQKRVRSAYLGIAATGTCYLQVLTDDNVERTYQLVPNAPGLGNERVDLARGVQSRYWSFSLESVDGSAWRLDNLEVLPVVLSRRVR